MVMDRRTVLKAMSLGGVGAIFCEIPGIADTSGNYVAAFDFAADTFTGTITEPDGTVNNLAGYHGVGTLPPLGGTPCPPTSSTADVVLSGAVNYPQGFTVPAGQVWELDADTDTTVTVGGNIVVNGTLRAHPSPTVTHRIRFVGINEANVVGGMAMAPVASDVGLWVDGGVLDISGTVKESWNRTGTHPTWAPTDELIVCPTTPGAYKATPYTGAVPSASSVARNGVQHTHHGEVVNLTRNVIVESVDGRAHIMFINVTEPQRFEYAELRRLGPLNKLGRYPLHVHMCGDGTDGSSFRGLVARDCANHAFVPHLSHGCDFSGSIAYRTTLDAFWWDLPDHTDRTRWDRCGAIETVNGSGFILLNGRGNSVIESFAFGTDANSSNAGILWPSQSNPSPSPWASDGIVAHNNKTHGIRVWHNTQTFHTVMGAVAYNNGRSGFAHGAYKNRYRYQFCVAFGNVAADFDALALGEWEVSDCWLERVNLGHHNVVGTPALGRFEMSELWPIGTVTIAESGFPGTFSFISEHNLSDMAPTAFTVTGAQLSTVIVSNWKRADFTLTP